MPNENAIRAEELQRRKALGTLFLVIMVDLLGFGIIIPALPLYMDMYGGSAMMVGILFAAFSACQFVSTPVLGGISDRVGRRPVLFYSQIGSAIGFLLLGIATQFKWSHVGIPLVLIFVSRIIDGISGGNISTAQAYISDIIPPEKRSAGMSVIGMGFGIGFTIGPMIGGIFGDKWLFMPGYLAAGMSLIAAALTFKFLPESLKEKTTGSHWMKWEHYRPILMERTSGTMMMITFLGMCAFVIMETMIALFLKAKLGWGMRETGLFLAFQGVVIIITQGFLVRKLSGRVGEWTMSIGGMIAMALGMICISGVGVWGGLWLLVFAGAVSASGRSFWQPTFSSLISKNTPADRQGSAFGVYWGVSAMARVVAPIGAGWVYLTSKPAPFVMAAGLLVICVLWMWKLKGWVEVRN